jgi:hypothetical protein
VWEVTLLKIPSRLDYNPPSDLPKWFLSFGSKLTSHFRALSSAVNGQISFGDPVNGPDNIKMQWHSGTTPATSDTEFAVPHNLGYIPKSYEVASKNKSGDIYTSIGGTSWTLSNIYLKASVASLQYTLRIY